MPLYSYRYTDTDELVDVYQSMKDEKLIILGGRPVVRQFTPPMLTGIEARTDGYPRLSNSLPTTIRGVKLVADPKSGRLKPLITSRRHEREVMAKNDLVRESETFHGEEF